MGDSAAGQRAVRHRLTRRRVLAAGVSLVAAAGGATAWAAWADAADDRREEQAAEVEQTLSRRATAVLARDAASLAATVVPVASGGSAAADLRQRQYALVANLAQVPLGDWRYRVTAFDAFPLPAVLGTGERVAVEVELGYRLAGFDAQLETATQYLIFERQPDGRWLLASDGTEGGDHPGNTVLIWDLGPVRAVRGRYSLVLGLRDPATLAAIGAEADRAVPDVSAVWGSGWGQRTVVLAPLASDQFGALLDADPAAFADIAAVTTGELGASELGRTERITLNPIAWDSLSALGQRVVTTHETTHVATRAQTDAWTPRWLSEGVADWTGYLGTGRTPQQIAVELGAALASGGSSGSGGSGASGGSGSSGAAARLLAALPADADFSGTAPALQEAYQKAWFACRSVVLHHGQAKLVALYAAVAATGGRGGQDAAVDRALRATLGVGTAAFTAQWRADVESALRR
ncbi:hypothetical protein [Streptacidiphilus fuscans]|uniref:Peptidase MA-like domain-containing protein n=1 Tax=Streptacidiphilus fuscans TaxID=2789292 RepID=A0A931B6B8_9ACTN|nr:hypothetical protein [Streptacidiphilus fuscans]MBF9071053.1 hypothetical protein [Streptacidiphilus fuscans]